ncbi:MAG: helix-turn-helix domain-containing protein [Dehalococcoidia bacterium]|nr:MAG: helix-turn-helix domain-containing protein [Dehalococcoidia bacterium]
MGNKEEIIRLKEASVRNCEIARRLHISKQYVSRICNKTQGEGKPKHLLKKKFICVGVASRLTGMSINTLTWWADEGRIESYRLTGQRKDRRFKIEDLKRLISVDELELDISNTIKLVKVGDVSNMLGLSPDTVRKWCDQGKIKCIRIGQGGARRFRL